MHIPETPADSADIMRCLQKQNSNPQGQWRLWAPKSCCTSGQLWKIVFGTFLFGTSEVISGLLTTWTRSVWANFTPSFLRPQNAHLPQQPPFAPAGMAHNGQVKRASDAVRNGHQSTWPKRTWITLGNLSQNVFLKLDLVGICVEIHWSKTSP